MSGGSEGFGAMAQRAACGLWEGAHLSLLWVVRVARVRMERRRMRGAKKRVAEALQSLGAEVYALTRRGEAGEISEVPAVSEALAQVRLAEAAALSTDAAAESLDARMKARAREVRERHAARRAAGATPPAPAPSGREPPSPPAREDRPEVVPEDPADRR